LEKEATANNNPEDWEGCASKFRETLDLCFKYEKPFFTALYISLIRRQCEPSNDLAVATTAISLGKHALQERPESSLFCSCLFSELSKALNLLHD
jgi:hypothetical protein